MITRFRKLGLLAGLAVGFAAGAHAVAPDFMDKLDADARPAEDKARDGIRRPYQVMQLLEVEEGMTVVDVVAGGGWYTEVLSAAVGPDGTVIAQFGPRGGDEHRQRAERLGNVEPVFDSLDSIEEGAAERALTALSLHHRDASFLEDVYSVLEPGGMAAIIDHEGDEGASNNEDLHRVAKADAMRMIEEAGFEIVEDSDLLHTNADDHSMAIFAPELGRNTDRFLFIVRKPEMD